MESHVYIVVWGGAFRNSLLPQVVNVGVHCLFVPTNGKPDCQSPPDPRILLPLKKLMHITLNGSRAYTAQIVPQLSSSDTTPGRLVWGRVGPSAVPIDRFDTIAHHALDPSHIVAVSL